MQSATLAPTPINFCKAIWHSSSPNDFIYSKSKSNISGLSSYLLGFSFISSLTSIASFTFLIVSTMYLLLKDAPVSWISSNVASLIACGVGNV